MPKIKIEDLAKQASEQNQQQQQKQGRHKELTNIVSSSDAVQNAIVQTTRVLLDYLDDNDLTAEVKNFPEFPKEISTPDVTHVVAALEGLNDVVREKNVDLSPVIEALYALGDMVDTLPKAFPQIPEPLKTIEVNNISDVTKALGELQKELKKKKLETKVDVKPTDVKIDLKPLEKKLDKVCKALEDYEPVEIDVPETNLKPLEKAIKNVDKSINSLAFPVPNVKPMFIDADGNTVRPQLDANGKIQTTATFSGSVNAVTEYDDASSTVATPSAPGITFDNAGTINFVSDTNPLPVDATVNATVDLGDTNIGNATVDTQRVVLASDQPTVSVDLGANNDVSVTGTVTVDGSGVTQPVSGTVTANLSATDNAVLDAIETTLNSIETGQLADGHNVTVDNASIAVTGVQTDALTDTELRATPITVDLGTNNDVTVSGTVTANLSAVDNAVLDAIETTLNSIETGQLADGHNVTVDNASIAVTDNGGSLTVDGSVTATLATADKTRGSTSGVTSVAGSATSVQLLASNSSRKEATITNDSTADLYIKLGTTASTTSYTVKIGQDESYITDKYTGRIDGIWASATGNARITQIT